MKKLFKRVIPMVLIVAMCLCMSVSAFADSTVYSRMRNFPSQWWGNSSNSTGYVALIQSAMWAYGGSSRSKIVNGGGTDGSFGENTYWAVYYFQQGETIGVDGTVGPTTWGTIGSLAYHTNDSGYYYTISGYYFLRISGSPSTSTAWAYLKRTGTTGSSGYKSITVK